MEGRMADCLSVNIARQSSLSIMMTIRDARLLGAMTLLIIACSSSAPAAQNSNETPYAASRLVGRWRTVMNRALEESRASAEENVTDAMEEFVSPGAVRAVQDKATEEQLKKADAVLERFVSAMIKASTRQPDGSVVVEASAIEPAEKAICPVYPFCDR
jgi:hypothetical protein